jgi:Undecaprenyl-phosphate glucose phosphotransferase
MVRKNNLKQKIILILGDVISINLGLFFAAAIKFFNGIEYHNGNYPQFFFVFNIVWFLIIWGSQGYEIKRTDTIPSRITKVLGILVLHGMIVSSLWVSFKAYYYSREFLLISYTLLIPILVTWRVAMVSVLRMYRKHGMNYRNIVVYGYGDIATEFVALLRLHSEYGYNFRGYFDDQDQSNQVIGSFDEIKEYTINNKIDEIYCCIPYVDYSNIRELIDFGDESLVKIKLLTDFRGFASKGIELQRYEHIPVLNVTSTPLDDWKNRFVKRLFDVVFSFLVIILIFSWLFPIVALLIKFESKGPIFFKQKRTGLDNNDFNCYKFRTMRVNNDSDDLQATKGDKRITKTGNFLRKSSIDELPQFFNVLLGSMSVIGPRPHMLKHTEEYSKKIVKFMARHLVKPGITGLAQAKGFRGETYHLKQMKNRVKMDRFYVDNWSIWLDLKIILLTIVSIIKGDENAF